MDALFLRSRCLRMLLVIGALGAAMGCKMGGQSMLPPAAPASSAAPGAPAASAAPLPASGDTIVVSGAAAGTIGPSFVGFSYQKSALSQGLFTDSNADLVGLFKRLGPGLLRIGCISVDHTAWNPSGAGGVSGETGPSDITHLAAFLQATGWKALYGLNFSTSSSSAAASEAAYTAKTLGSALYAFEIGNEPDLYGRDSNTTYTVQDFSGGFNSFASAISAAVPKAVFTGPAAAGNLTSFTVPFATLESGKIALLTQHYYMAAGSSPSSTVTDMLSPAENQKLVLFLDTLGKAAAGHAAGGARLSEANDYYDGGARGVSDTFASALWAVDFLFTNAAHTSTGVNFQSGGAGTGYVTIADDSRGTITGVRPEFYGILLAALAGQGTLLQTKVSAGSMNVSAYALGSSISSVSSLVIVNKEAQTFSATVRLPTSPQGATLTLLTAPSVSATSGMTIGGGTIGLDGTVSIKPTTLTVSGGLISVTVPAMSAGLIQIGGASSGAPPPVGGTPSAAPGSCTTAKQIVPTKAC